MIERCIVNRREGPEELNCILCDKPSEEVGPYKREDLLCPRCLGVKPEKQEEFNLIHALILIGIGWMMGTTMIILAQVIF